ncbi:MAG: glycoside hydrolase family 78 protein [Bacteroidales bacterium]|nr:glycoside hydrolase family 78 protein [Bacteroidales bacterium]
MKISFLSLFLFLILLFSCNENPSIKVVNLTCESLTDPLGIDTPTPRLSWQLSSNERDIEQTGYRIIVSSSLQKLNGEEGDIWDSEATDSDNSILIPYTGPIPESRKTYYWKVKVSTNKGESKWSEPASWTMGFLQPSDWHASWIGLDKSFPGDVLEDKTKLSARYLRKEFVSDKEIKNATLYISGLGLYEAYLNGERIGTQVLSPTATDYSKSVKYNTFDVTDLLRKGDNAMGVILGNGRFFSMRQPKKMNLGIPEIRHFGFPKMIAQLEILYTDGSKQIITSDDSWKITANGPIRSNSEFDGEEYDALMEMPGWNRAHFDDNNWLQAEMVEAPEGKIESQYNYNIEVMDTIYPIAITEPKPGMYIVDMGQNMVGWLHMKIKGNKGDQVQLRFAETLKDDGTLYLDNIRGALVTDRYILKGGDTETWEPSFTYHGFRFVEITGFPGKPSLADFEGKVVYDGLKTIGNFETSNALINQIYKNAYWGTRSNYRSMPTDCPQRDERMGWLGDRGMESLGESFMFDIHLFYVKWLNDIEQSQRADGSIPDVAPNYWKLYNDNMTWCGAYLLIANMLYEQFGDKEPILSHYASMKKWINYMKEKYAVDHIMTKDTYGDWCMPPESPELIHSNDPNRMTNPAVLSTTYYYHLLNLLTRFATLSDNPTDAVEFAKEAEAVKKAYNDKFLNKREGYYDNNTVTANILSLRYGMVPEEYKEAVFNNVVKKTLEEFNGHVSTGLVGMQQLMRGLSDYGRTDIAYKIATNKTYPSWGYMIENGATTIWELWNGNTADPSMNSGNHLMLLGDLIPWFYEYLAGIKNAPGSVAFKKIAFKPYFTDDLNFVQASFESVQGVIASSWEKEDGTFRWKITVPANTTATVYLPTSDKNSIKIDHKRTISAERAEFVKLDDGFAVFEVKSGDYHFSSDL